MEGIVRGWFCLNEDEKAAEEEEEEEEDKEENNEESFPNYGATPAMCWKGDWMNEQQLH